MMVMLVNRIHVRQRLRQLCPHITYSGWVAFQELIVIKSPKVGTLEDKELFSDD